MDFAYKIYMCYLYLAYLYYVICYCTVKEHGKTAAQGGISVLHMEIRCLSESPQNLSGSCGIQGQKPRKHVDMVTGNKQQHCKCNDYCF